VKQVLRTVLFVGSMVMASILTSCAIPASEGEAHADVSSIARTMYSIGKSVDEVEQENGPPKEVVGDLEEDGFNGTYIYYVSDARAEHVFENHVVIRTLISVDSRDPNAFTGYVRYLEEALGDPAKSSLNQVEWLLEDIHVLVSGSKGKYEIIASSR